MPQLVFFKNGKFVTYAPKKASGSVTNNTTIISEGEDPLVLTAKSIPYAGNDGLLTEDNLGLSYDVVNGNLIAGNKGAGTDSGIIINGSRGKLLASQSGIKVQGGIGTGGVFDTTKHVQLQNGDNVAYIDAFSSGAGPYQHHILMSLIVANNFANDAAAAAGGIGVGELYHNAGALRIRIA